MTLVRRIAQPMLASVFVYGGLESLRRPSSRGAEAEPVARPLGRKIPYLPEDPAQLAKINAGAQIGAGSLLALGRFPRLSALVLAGSLVPTTVGGHRFWEETDPAAKEEQQHHFLKNVGLLGGLLTTAVDTGGRPSVFWLARRAGKTSTRAAKLGGKSARLSAKGAGLQAKLGAAGAAQGAKLGAKSVAQSAKLGAKGAAQGAKGAAQGVKVNAKGAKQATRIGTKGLGLQARIGARGARQQARLGTRIVTAAPLAGAAKTATKAALASKVAKSVARRAA